MANNSTSLSQQDTLFIELNITLPFLIGSFIVVVLAIVLNAVEVRLLVKKIRKATDFELVLLNLAVADLIGGIDFAAITILSAYKFSIGETSVGAENFPWVFGFILFSIVSSTTFVTIIGVERFLAIKVPLRHRLFHIDRRYLFGKIALTWLFNIVVAAAPLIFDYLISEEITYTGTRRLAYVLTGYLTIVSIVIVVIYIWLAHLVVARSLTLFAFDKQDFKFNAKSARKAMKKEKATIAVCFLVLVLFLVCNLPIVIHLYQMKVEHISGILIKLNSVCNPLVYFFKGYLEKQFVKKGTDLDSSKEKGGVGSKAKVQSSEEKGEIETGETKLDIVNQNFPERDLGLQGSLNDEVNCSNEGQNMSKVRGQIAKRPELFNRECSGADSRREATIAQVNQGLTMEE